MNSTNLAILLISLEIFKHIQKRISILFFVYSSPSADWASVECKKELKRLGTLIIFFSMNL